MRAEDQAGSCRSASRCSSALAAWLVFGDVADGFSINMHPMAFAAWFGLLATALNLFPIGQLDGGHIATRCSAAARRG